MEKKVVELFAGVGGFRVGLNNVKLDKNGKTIEKNNFKFVWANQWEPSTKVQDAFLCYKTRFSKGNDDHEFSNEDISLVDKNSIPDFTLLTGGFPCQDYSVARSLSKEKGIEGKKGVLWWQINDILIKKNPPFVLLENVDRLLKSPSTQRGRDFGVMLRCFHDNNYSVEWRVINAAEYGHPQKRKRVYIFAYKNNTRHSESIIENTPEEIIFHKGIFAINFPISSNDKVTKKEIKDFVDLVEVSNDFEFSFENTGFLRDGIITTSKVYPHESKTINLIDILESNVIDSRYFLSEDNIKKFDYLKGNKRIDRISKSGHKYVYSEGKMTYPDDHNKPGRTMLTSEGTVNRSTHVVLDIITGEKRFITPIEAERLNEFPDNWTEMMSDKRRYFMMGNALVTGIVKKLGKSISKIIENEE
ncbi:DNA (cytosine-5-)-methyltransferase [Haploplasma modicum]|uniref:DNA (cytosine-5-)-methyltransferase n=1 Tax=Haploplasma modicum TaxID=2150 RepID=UPI00047E7C81|nr:DNA (cytosine-5-)-methyltransferase [Haploplasma modicum]